MNILYNFFLNEKGKILSNIIYIFYHYMLYNLMYMWHTNYFKNHNPFYQHIINTMNHLNIYYMQVGMLYIWTINFDNIQQSIMNKEHITNLLLYFIYEYNLSIQINILNNYFYNNEFQEDKPSNYLNLYKLYNFQCMVYIIFNLWYKNPYHIYYIV